MKRLIQAIATVAFLLLQVLPLTAADSDNIDTGWEPLQDAAPQAGQIWTEPTTGMEFVWIPAGCFMMGTPDSEKGREEDEKPRHEVCVDGFWMGRYEVTNKQFRQYNPEAVYPFEDDEKEMGSPDRPAVYTNFLEAKKFIQWLSSKGYGKFRLPTEAEWEYACRSGTDTRFFWGESEAEACKYANINDRSAVKEYDRGREVFPCEDNYFSSAPVGSYKPNQFGLYDMLGNAMEWCEDWYNVKAYSYHSRKNPFYKGKSDTRVVRGGSFINEPQYARSGNRYKLQDWDGKDLQGFRLVKEQP
ncbi:formylglycine-generating enzyme family protein [Maridesulfovibrio sp.]|uniref:formylglycine-generating enzyme family protein n=1 Tax=Maridesulfovibrio sp. TaxID=2795000 RepID=UPI003BAD8831